MECVGSWFLALEPPKDLTQFCGALFSLEFPGVKEKNKFQGGFKKSMSSTPVCFFSGIVQYRLALFHAIRNFLVNEILLFF